MNDVVSISPNGLTVKTYRLSEIFAAEVRNGPVTKTKTRSTREEAFYHTRETWPFTERVN